jgi:hypothetical protein
MCRRLDPDETAAKAVDAGRRVFVRCHSGGDRSGLVVAGPRSMMRSSRSGTADPGGPERPPFVGYLKTGFDVVPLPIGLDL